MRLYLIRHADPDYATDSITEEGRLEAAALGERMAGEDLDRLYASPLGRAQQTAAAVAERTGLTIQTQDWTAEWGHLRCDTSRGPRCVWDLDGEELLAHGDPADPRPWREHPLLDGDDLHTTWDAMVAASDAFLAAHGYRRDGHRYRVEQGNRERLAVVCHGGFGLGWLAHLLGIPPSLVWAGFWLPPTSVSIVLLDERSDHWATPRMLCVGDTSHLHAAGRRALPRGIKANFD